MIDPDKQSSFLTAFKNLIPRFKNIDPTPKYDLRNPKKLKLMIFLNLNKY